MKNLKKQTRKILFTLFLIICSTFKVAAQDTNVDYSRLITAIGTVESKLNDKTVNGVHAGFLQIAKVTVAECNRINKIKKVSKRYTLQDRFNHQKSIEMFWIIQKFYNPKLDIDYMVLLWKEGRSAMKKPKRKTSYYNKVMNVYNKLTN